MWNLSSSNRGTGIKNYEVSPLPCLIIIKYGFSARNRRFWAIESAQRRGGLSTVAIVKVEDLAKADSIPNVKTRRVPSRPFVALAKTDSFWKSSMIADWLLVIWIYLVIVSWLLVIFLYS